MSTAWVFQEAADVRDLGADKAPWQTSWYEPSGRRKKKSFGPGFMGKKRAERFKNKVENELMSGTYQMEVRKTWEDFVAEYERRVLAGKAVGTRLEALGALQTFKRIVKPVRLIAVTTAQVDDFIAARRQERGKKKGDTISPATVNKDLRHVKAALKKAKKWGYLHAVPEFDFEKEPGKLPTYVTPEHFAALYHACEGARWPDAQPYPAADWWRALLIMAYLTGWRIGQLLAVRRADVDLDARTVLSRAQDNKGKRDQLIPLDPVVIEHLRKLASFDTRLFPWNHHRRNLDLEFHRIQKAAGIHLPCHDAHEHTPACHVYGFHDLRRAFATLNADSLTPDALQALMQHKDYQTTQKYINMARQLNPTVYKVFVPDLTRKTGTSPKE
jgi:integrase